MQPDFNAEQFAATVEQAALSILADTDSGSAARAARQVQKMAEEVNRQHADGKDLIDCRAGCAHCCIVNVAVLNPEAAAICEYLVQNRLPEELEQLRSELSTLNMETRWLDDEERIMARRKCAFLSAAGSCSIYPVRPLLCRSVTSTDSADCKEALAMIAFDENTPVMINLLHQEIFETAFMALGQALENMGHDNRSHRLTGSVQASLNNQLN